MEGRYAAALYSAAHKQNKLDQVDKDLQTVKEIYQSNKQFKVCHEGSLLFFFYLLGVRA